MMSGPSPSSSLHEEPDISKKWKCIECDQVFTQSKLLETHAVDTDHKAYRCTKEKACGKVFTLRPSWIRHESSHSAKKTHACTRCGKKFHRKDNCHDHERTCGRVASRARRLLQSTSTSPTTTTTSSGSTESGTPVDLLTTVLHEEEPSHAAETGYGGLKSFATPDATIQRDNGHDDEKATLSVSRQFHSVPTKPPPAFATAALPMTNNGPTQSRAAVFHDTTASHTLEPENDTLLTVDNTEIPTASRNTISEPHPGSDWRHYFQIFQSPYDAPSPDLQHTEDNWVIAPEIQASTFYGPPWRNLGYSHSYWPTYATAGSTRRDNSDVDIIHNHASGVHYSSIMSGEPVNGFGWFFKEIQDILHKAWRVPGRRPHGKMAELPERKPPSKIATFFLRVKAYIKAPFRRHKQ